MAKKATKHTEKPSRYRALRDDASIAAAQLKIARVFNLPDGCIRLVLPSGRKARSDKTVEGLRKDWGE